MSQKIYDPINALSNCMHLDILGSLLHESLASISAGDSNYLDVLLRIERLTTEWEDFECMAHFDALRDWIIAAHNRRSSDKDHLKNHQT